MIMSILLLARATGVVFADDPQTQLLENGAAGRGRATCSTR